MQRAPRLAAAILCALLAGCSWFGSGDSKKIACPATEIAPDLDALTVPRPGGGTAPADIRFGVKLYAAESKKCESEKVGLGTDTKITFIVARGDQDLKVGDFTYFMAVVDARRTILAKRLYTLHVEFDGRQTQMRVYEDMHTSLPVRDVSNGDNYAIIVGLQLTPEQLDLNRRRSAGVAP